MSALLLIVAMITYAIAYGAVIYQHIVEFPNWKKDIPHSLVLFRAFFKYAGFGKFFKIFMPVSSISLLIAIFLAWNHPHEANIWTALSMAGLIITAAFTNIYFIPRHKKLFTEETQTNDAELKIIATQWGKGNILRIIIMTVTLASFLEALSTILVNK